MWSCTVFDLFSEGLRPLRAFPLKENFPVALRLRFWSKRGRWRCFSTFTFIVAETGSVSFCALSFRFPLIAFSLLSFNADRFPFTSTHASLHCGLQFLTVRRWIVLPNLLFVQCQYGFELIRPTNAHLITNFPEHPLSVPAALITKLHPIWVRPSTPQAPWLPPSSARLDSTARMSSHRPNVELSSTLPFPGSCFIKKKKQRTERFVLAGVVPIL